MVKSNNKSERFSFSSKEKRLESMVKGNKKSKEKRLESMAKSNNKSEEGLIVIKTPGDFLFNQCMSLGSGIFSSTGRKKSVFRFIKSHLYTHFVTRS